MKFSKSTFPIIFFAITSIFFTTFILTSYPEFNGLEILLYGLTLGFVLSTIVVYFEKKMKTMNLSKFNLILLGLFCGYFLSSLIINILSAFKVNHLVSLNLWNSIEGFNIIICSYFGVLLTFKASNEIYLSIPFVKLKPLSDNNKKDVILEASVLQDSRIIDFASSGILDHQLVVPRFVIKHFTLQSEANEEDVKNKAKKSLDVLKKLESLPDLHLRFTDIDFPDTKEIVHKYIKLARFIDANLLTSDLHRVQQSTVEGVKFININFLSNALKPLKQQGEILSIAIQKCGKDPGQGIGFLEDSTMVVVNGGSKFILETVKARVLSVKHTPSGRMIFCNVIEEDDPFNNRAIEKSAQMSYV